jgi:hypothetical protein
MGDYDGYSLEFLQKLSRSYREGGLEAPRALSEALYKQSVCTQEEFWVQSDLGLWETHYEYSGRKTVATIDPVVMAIAKYRQDDVRYVIRDLQAIESDWYTSSRLQKRQWYQRMRRDYPARVHFHIDVYTLYLSVRLEWAPTMEIGSGTTVHLRPDELPMNALVRCSGSEILPVLQGRVHWPTDPTRGGKRAVYGYWL